MNDEEYAYHLQCQELMQYYTNEQPYMVIDNLQFFEQSAPQPQPQPQHEEESSQHEQESSQHEQESSQHEQESSQHEQFETQSVEYQLVNILDQFFEQIREQQQQEEDEETDEETDDETDDENENLSNNESGQLEIHSLQSEIVQPEPVQSEIVQPELGQNNSRRHRTSQHLQITIDSIDRILFRYQNYQPSQASQPSRRSRSSLVLPSLVPSNNINNILNSLIEQSSRSPSYISYTISNIERLIDNNNDNTYEDLLRLSELIGDVSKGASKEQIDKIDIFAYQQSQYPKNTSCSICLSDFLENDPISKLSQCNHLFHHQCVLDWIKINAICPLCRKDI